MFIKTWKNPSFFFSFFPILWNEQKWEMTNIGEDNLWWFPFPLLSQSCCQILQRLYGWNKKKNKQTLEVKFPEVGLTFKETFTTKIWNENKVWFIASCNLGFVLVTMAIYHIFLNSLLFYIFLGLETEHHPVLMSWLCYMKSEASVGGWDSKAGSFDLLTYVFGSLLLTLSWWTQFLCLQHLGVVSPHPATLGFFTTMMSGFWASSESEQGRLCQVYHPSSEIRQCSSATLSL